MFGKRLREVRNKKNLTQAELGRLIGIGKTTISQYESEDRSPDLETVNKLANVLSCSVDWLLGRTPTSSNQPTNDIITILNSPDATASGKPLSEHKRKKIRQIIEEAEKENLEDFPLSAHIEGEGFEVDDQVRGVLEKVIRQARRYRELQRQGAIPPEDDIK